MYVGDYQWREIRYYNIVNINERMDQSDLWEENKIVQCYAQLIE